MHLNTPQREELLGLCVMTGCPAWRILVVSSGWQPPARESLPADSLRSPLRSGRLVSDARPPPPRPETDTNNINTPRANTVVDTSAHSLRSCLTSAGQFLCCVLSWPYWRRSWRRLAGRHEDSRSLRRCWSQVLQSLSPGWCCGASDPWGGGGGIRIRLIILPFVGLI